MMNLKKTCKKGFILYLVVALIMGLAILSFSLSAFKSGSVRMLSKNIDQNRLTLLAQSANAETIAFLRDNANNPESPISKYFRVIFQSDIKNCTDEEFAQRNTIKNVPILENYVPPKASEIAASEGIKSIQSNVTLSYYHEADYKSITAYNGYIDVSSLAIGKNGSAIEIKERREIRVTDLTHYLDKYALYVKCFSNDYNNPNKRIIVKGVQEQDKGYFSRVYLGNHAYPDDTNKGCKYRSDSKAKENETYVYLDLYYPEHQYLNNGIMNLFGKNSLDEFYVNSPPGRYSKFNEDQVMYKRTIPFCSFGQTAFASRFNELFAQVTEIRKEYEKIVNYAAWGYIGKPQQKVEPPGDKELWDNCDKALKAAKESNKNIDETNNAAYKICLDYKNNCKKSTNPKYGNRYDYSKSEVFTKMLSTSLVNWQYEYSYIDANSIWDFSKKDSTLNDWLPKAWTSNSDPVQNQDDTYAAGLADLHDKAGNKALGSYRLAFADYNFPRSSVGRMISLFGENVENGEQPIPVIVEGPVFLRFFKLAYLASYSAILDFDMNENNPVINPYNIPLKVRRVNAEEEFMNYKLPQDFSSNPGLFNDNYMMSYAIDWVPINELCFPNNALSSYDQYYKESTSTSGNIYKPYMDGKMFKGGRGVDASRVIDETCESYGYASSAEFITERVNEEGVVHVDGTIFIQNGDLDLSNATKFLGSGIIYIRHGNCKLGNLAKVRETDTLRIYLQHGEFQISKDFKKVKIDASLASFLPYDDGPYNELANSYYSNDKMGKLRFSGQDEVRIFGNLLVDYIYTDAKSDSLADKGKLIIEHDPRLFDPDLYTEEKGAYSQWVSIGPVKNTYAINAEARNVNGL